MKVIKKVTDENINFNHTAPNRLKFWQQVLLWILRVPANDILFFGITCSLGAASLWLAQTLINPATNSERPIFLLQTGNNNPVSGALLIGIMILIGLGFWIGAAYVTHRFMAWLARLLQVERFLALLQIGLLCLSWLPLLSLLGTQNNKYSAQIVGVGGIVMILAASLFIIEALLLNYWISSDS